MSSISKSFPAFRVPPSALRIVSAGVFALSAHFIRADLNSEATPKLKKKDILSASHPITAVAAPVSTEVNRGGKIVIRIQGIASGGGQLEFRLLQKPLHGRILNSKPAGMNSLDVTYVHSGDSASDHDFFIFGVRSAAGGPFSPGQAKITITSSPGHLLVPEALTFPSTLTGQTASDSFVVVNEGGEVLNGKITISEPWHLVEPAAYQLSPGEKRKITVLFTPKNHGPCEGRLIFEGAKPAFVNLLGEGLGSFLASPAKLVLAPTLDGKRRGVVSLQNNTTEPIVIEVESNLDLPKSVTLQFGETKELTVEDSGIGLLTSHITFKASAYARRVEVVANEAAARILPTPALVVISPTPAPVAPSTPPVSYTPQATPESSPIAEEEPHASPPSTSVPLLFISVRLVPLSNSRIKLEWSADAPISHYTIEQRYLLLDEEKKIKVQWVPVPSAKITVSGSQGVALIEDLDADTAFTFRIVQTDSDARITSLPVTHRTPPGFFHRFTWRSFIFPLGVLSLGLILWKRWRARISAD